MFKVYVNFVILIGYKNTFLNWYMDFGRLITTSALRRWGGCRTGFRRLFLAEAYVSTG